MKLKSLVLKAGSVVAPLVLMLSLGGIQPALAAGSIVVATTSTPTNCGSHHTAVTDLAGAIQSASARTILVCPGDYNLVAQNVTVSGLARLTIKQAVPGSTRRPRIIVNPGSSDGLLIRNSNNVTIDGLIIDGSMNGQTDYSGIHVERSAATIRNTDLLGSNTTNNAILVNNSGVSTVRKLTLSNVRLLGYHVNGVHVMGAIKLNISKSVVDALPDGGFISAGQRGIWVDGGMPGASPSGTISQSTIRNNGVGVFINETSKVTVSKNVLTGNAIGVQIATLGAFHPVMRNNKVQSNTITPALNGKGVFVDAEPVNPSMGQILNTTVSKNVIRVSQPGAGDLAIDFFAFAPSTQTVTGTVIGNTLSGFMNGNFILNTNNFAGLKIKTNKFLP